MCLDEIRGDPLQFVANDQKITGTQEVHVSFFDPGNLSKAPDDTKPEVIIQSLGLYVTKPRISPILFYSIFSWVIGILVFIAQN